MDKIIGNLEYFLILVILLGFGVLVINLRGLKRGILDTKLFILIFLLFTLLFLLLSFVKGFFLEGLLALSFIELLFLIFKEFRLLILFILLIILLLLLVLRIVIIILSLLLLFFTLGLLIILDLLILRNIFWFLEAEVGDGEDFIWLFWEEKVLILGLDMIGEIWDWEEKILILGLDLVIFDRVFLVDK